MDFGNRRISEFRRLVTLTLTLDRVISCITHRPLQTRQISFESEKNCFVAGRTYTVTVETRFIRSTPPGPTSDPWTLPIVMVERH